MDLARRRSIDAVRHQDGDATRANALLARAGHQ
jgi:hypothetical protein